MVGAQGDLEEGPALRGYKVVPYCPRCGTPLSSHEVAQGYKDVTERSAMVEFKAKDGDYSFLAWTTTPWTLPSNMALCVNPAVTTSRSRSATRSTSSQRHSSTRSSRVSRASVRFSSAIRQGPRVPRVRAALSVCRREDQEPARQKGVHCDLRYYVTTEDGTGIVHMAPAYGEDDNRVCQKYGVAFVNLVNSKGELTAETDSDRPASSRRLTR